MNSPRVKMMAWFWFSGLPSPMIGLPAEGITTNASETQSKETEDFMVPNERLTAGESIRRRTWQLDAIHLLNLGPPIVLRHTTNTETSAPVKTMTRKAHAPRRQIQPNEKPQRMSLTSTLLMSTEKNSSATTLLPAASVLFTAQV